MTFGKNEVKNQRIKMAITAEAQKQLLVDCFKKRFIVQVKRETEKTEKVGEGEHTYQRTTLSERRGKAVVR
jgi:hypothetical protein